MNDLAAGAAVDFAVLQRPGEGHGTVRAVMAEERWYDDRYLGDGRQASTAQTEQSQLAGHAIRRESVQSAGSVSSILSMSKLRLVLMRRVAGRASAPTWPGLFPYGAVAGGDGGSTFPVFRSKATSRVT